MAVHGDLFAVFLGLNEARFDGAEGDRVAADVELASLHGLGHAHDARLADA